MSKSQELLQYLSEQFPATVGHMPLITKVQAVYREGEEDAMKWVSQECNRMTEKMSRLQIPDSFVSMVNSARQSNLSHTESIPNMTGAD